MSQHTSEQSVLFENLSKKTVIARHKRRKKRVRRITIDLHPTGDPTHGAPQLTFFNRFYDMSFYLPLAGFLTFDEEVEQYLFVMSCAPVTSPPSAVRPMH